MKLNVNDKNFKRRLCRHYDELENGEVFVNLNDDDYSVYIKCSTGPEHHEAVNLLDGTLTYILNQEDWLITFDASMELEVNF